ncbi:MAG TPA: 4a-hydroxytetrahydrobiopterin dehydratase [Bacteroidia bacterium]|nr:4a-hydroxytetrahydrobiopterin dehydratase [Bacteroidia bacterium]
MWTEANHTLSRSFVFHDFREAFAFMALVAFSAEKMNHHPDWRNAWNKVDIHLSTHDAGNKVTEKDRLLAAEIDKIYERFAA